MKNLSASAPLRLKKYPAYKDSGIEWLGEIPDNWDVTILKRVCRFAYGDALAAEGRIDGLFSVFGSNGIVGSHDTANTLGPCLILGRKGSFGKVTYSDNPAFAIDTTYFIDKRQTGANLRWLYYLLQWLQLDAFSKDSAVPGLAREDAYDRLVPVCDRGVQDLIASFLDRKTTEIDALIGKKRRMIELLQEKRTAVISHAVTKGLDPNAPMKDSGVEWLGKVPRHWEVKRLRFLIKGGLANGVFKKKDFFGSGIRLVNVFDVYRENYLIDQQSLDRVEVDEIEKKVYAVEDGDIFFVRSSLKLEGVGQSACVLKVDEPIVFECHLVRAQPDVTKVSSEFLINYLNSIKTKNRLVSVANTVTMATLDQMKLKDIEITMPLIEEQRAIVKHLQNVVSDTNSLISKIEAAIDKLLEYRTSLISAAVTGKIDVRNEVRA